jgi:hypothetical protein
MEPSSSVTLIMAAFLPTKPTASLISGRSTLHRSQQHTAGAYMYLQSIPIT